MRRLAIYFVVCSCLVLLSSVPAQQAGTENEVNLGLRGRDALAALGRYRRAEHEAAMVYTRAEKEARLLLIEELKAEQEKMTKANNLDEAIRIRAAVELASAGPLPRPPMQEAGATGQPGVGDWNVQFPSGRTMGLTLQADGSVLVDGKPGTGTWKYANGTLVIAWGTNEQYMFDRKKGETLMGKNKKGHELKLIPAKK